MLDAALLLSDRHRKLPQPIPLEDNLLVSCIAAGGEGGLLYVSKSSWWQSSTITIVDRIGTSGLSLTDTCFLRSIQDANFSIILATGSWGATWLNISREFRDIHDVRMHDGSVYLVSTGTDEIAKTSLVGELENKWTFPADGFTWHLNCLDVWEGRIVVSAFRRRSVPGDGVEFDPDRGCVMDLATEEILWDGLYKPHTPRADGDVRYVLESGRGKLLVRNGSVESVGFGNCFPRGLAIGKKYVYVGLSRLRHVKSQSETGLTAEIAILDKATLSEKGRITLPFNEVYDVVIAESPDGDGKYGLTTACRT